MWPTNVMDGVRGAVGLLVLSGLATMTRSALGQCGAGRQPRSGYLVARRIIQSKLDDGVEILLFCFVVFSLLIEISSGVSFSWLSIRIRIERAACIGLGYQPRPCPPRVLSH